jgi:photosystem II stability/assembly factor-like uncharacterized protein
MSTDAGQSWERIDGGATPCATVSSVSMDRTDRSRILVGYSATDTSFDKLWECADTQANPRVWTAPTGRGPGDDTLLPNVPVNAIARHHTTGDTDWYVATDIGVFGTNDEGDVWKDMTRPLGLPRVEVTDLRVHKNNYLFAATWGRGFWRLRLAPPRKDGISRVGGIEHRTQSP